MNKFKYYMNIANEYMYNEGNLSIDQEIEEAFNKFILDKKGKIALQRFLDYGAYNVPTNVTNDELEEKLGKQEEFQKFRASFLTYFRSKNEKLIKINEIKNNFNMLIIRLLPNLKKFLENPKKNLIKKNK